MEAFIASLIFFALAIFLAIGARVGQRIDARSADTQGPGGKKAQSRERPIHGNNRCPNPAEL
jgi:hypothetical protein